MKCPRWIRQLAGGNFALMVVALWWCASLSGFAQDQDVQGAPDQGAQLYETNCAVCHGGDGSGGKAESIITPNFVTMSDADLTKSLHDGTAAGMPGYAGLGDANIAALVRTMRKLQGQSNATAAAPVRGDAAAGRALYFGKAQCSSCHMVQGEGGFMAADLTAYGRSHTVDAIKQAIVTPDSTLTPDARVVEVQTKAGAKLSGVVRHENNFNIDLQTEDGRYHFLARSDLTDVQYTDHSLMPRDYGTKLTAAELDSIVSFLIAAGQATPAEPAAPRPRRGGGF
jgi:cytochrome c oxidase cbb3-type subunit III